MQFRDKAVMFLATGGFVGHIPVAPGTFGSLLGIPLCYALARIRLPWAIVGAVGLIVVAIWIAQRAETITNQKDPGQIVIDEIAGMVVTLIGIPFHLTSMVVGFFIFRALDIIKPFPIRSLERRISGGAGVVMDDVFAGIYGNLLVRLVLYIFGFH
ncbi:MAG: phosphatidylglycerophosphatase A [Deltaproteobacteria bacterium]|jgi:phosphatidylglycerophosphatase A|nr:phosphatidylglycerophosphatase A [Deltaproteobacteria bacterium]